MGHSHIQQCNRHRHAGFTLVAVLLVAVILLTLLAAVSTMVLAESRQTGLTARQQQAYNFAEAGLERFMAALQQAADGASDFPYDPGSLTGWIGRHGINQPGVVVTATYVREDGQPVTANQVPPYPHLIQVRSKGTVDGVQKTIVATVDLQFLGGLFQYALAALSKNGTGIQFDRDLVNLYPDLTISGRVYSDADIRWGNVRGVPVTLQTDSLAVDLGPHSPIQGREDLKNLPPQVPVTHLQAPLAFPTFDQMVASLRKRASSDVQEISTSGNGILLSAFGSSVYLPPLNSLWDLIWGRWSPIWINKDTVIFSNPNSALYVVGNPRGRTIVSAGWLHLLGLVGDSSERTLYVARGDVVVGMDQLSQILSNILGDLSTILGWLLPLLSGIDLSKLIPTFWMTGYIYAPNGTVTFGGAFLGVHGGVAAQQIKFHFLNSIVIDHRNDIMTDFDPQNRPELYIPQPVIVERHTE